MKRERVVMLGEVVRRLQDSVVLRVKEVPEVGLPVYSEGQGRVGYVSNVFGSKERPYVQVKLDEGVTRFSRLYVVVRSKPSKNLKP
ncbi:MAG: hypothetical protein NZ988_06115 [Thaumarchaeota archaeon]|nr:hypothetical protein [Candidatus Calditenuaceae archaeon]MDW8187598.1 hypothetical protein [Nitrososphaerota archaeon]